MNSHYACTCPGIDRIWSLLRSVCPCAYSDVLFHAFVSVEMVKRCVACKLSAVNRFRRGLQINFARLSTLCRCKPRRVGRDGGITG